MKVQKRRKKEMGEKRENELIGCLQGSLYYFIELYVKIKTEILGLLLDGLVK